MAKSAFKLPSDAVTVPRKSKTFKVAKLFSGESNNEQSEATIPLDVK